MDKTNNPEVIKIKRSSAIYYAVETLIFVVGLAILFCFKSPFYMVDVLVLAVSYVAFGYTNSAKIDDFAKMRYPEFYSLKGRPKNYKIKQRAKEENDFDTLSLKNHQTAMFALFVAYALLLVVAAAYII